MIPPRTEARRARVEAARGLVRLAEERAVTREEWDRVAEVRDGLEESARTTGDVTDAAAYGVLAIRSIADRPTMALPYGIRRVASRSTPGVTHELRRFGTRWVCTCRGHRARRTCEHSRFEEQRDRDAAGRAVAS